MSNMQTQGNAAINQELQDIEVREDDGMMTTRKTKGEAEGCGTTTVVMTSHNGMHSDEWKTAFVQCTVVIEAIDVH